MVGGEATPAVFTLMCVLTPVSWGSSQQQPLITVGNVTIVEHFVK